MESLQSNPFNSLHKIKLICASNTTNHHFSCWQPCMNFWDMAQENCSLQNQISKALWMGKKSQHSTAPIKPGTASLDKLLPLTNNAKPILSDFIYPYSKTSNKFSSQTSQKSKDGTLFGLNGSISSLAVSKDLFTMMLMVKNGFKPTLVLPMPS